ncbi:MAG: hypothetical protein M3Z06_06500 [Actinomycetota bacterium]|nr:hypothetical protein [Actinomycetota bacterium]
MSVDDQKDAEDRRWESFRALNIDHAKLRPLIDRLNADLIAAQGGFPAFAAIADLRQRAVCSDLVYSSAESVAANLVEARLHSDAVAQCIGATGIAMPMITGTAEEQLLPIHIQKDIAGFFRALGSTLDCLAACAIGVLAIPRSIQAADISDLDQQLPGLRASPSNQTPSQVEAWDGLLTILANAKRKPDDWYDWALSMRNALIHRARAMTINMPRGRGDDLVIATADPSAFQRFDVYVRAQPLHTEMEEMIDIPTLRQTVLEEPVTSTLAGVHLLLSSLVEDVSDHLLTVWLDARGGTASFPMPVAKWSVKPRTFVFRGVAPVTPISATSVNLNPRDAKRADLANEVKRRVGK